MSVGGPMPFRFWGKVLIGDGCWEWQGGKNEHGYGVFWHNARLTKAHRVAWDLWYGPPPEDQFVCHRCDNRGCVRPAHLFLGTQSDNMADLVAKGRKRGRPRRPGNLCRNGHPYLTDKNGNRGCPTCHYAARLKREKGNANV